MSLIQKADLDQMAAWGRAYAMNPDHAQLYLYRAAEYVAAAASSDEEWRLIAWFELGVTETTKSQIRVKDAMWYLNDRVKYLRNQ